MTPSHTGPPRLPRRSVGRHRRLRPLVLWAECVAFAACAETTRGALDGAASPSPIDPAGFFERDYELACRGSAGCPGSDRSAYYASAATCMAASRRYLVPYRRQLLEQVVLGRIRFDSAAAARCLADIADHCATDVREGG